MPRRPATTRSVTPEQAGTMRVFTDAGSPVPEVHLISNGQYHVAVTSAGGGYSRWRDLAVTRWREDTTRDCWGSFCYLRDLESGTLWSTAWHPTATVSKFYEAIFTESRAEFRRRDEQIETHTQISVSAEDDLELRRVTLTNRSERLRTIELTSYAEVSWRRRPRMSRIRHSATCSCKPKSFVVDRQSSALDARGLRKNDRPG